MNGFTAWEFFSFAPSVWSKMELSSVQIGFVFLIIRLHYMLVSLASPWLRRRRFVRARGACHFLLIVGAVFRSLGLLVCFFDITKFAPSENGTSTVIDMAVGGCLVNTGLALFDTFHEALATEAATGRDTGSLMATKSAAFSIGSIAGGVTIFGLLKVAEIKLAGIVFAVIAVSVVVATELLRVAARFQDAPAAAEPDTSRFSRAKNAVHPVRPLEQLAQPESAAHVEVVLALDGTLSPTDVEVPLSACMPESDKRRDTGRKGDQELKGTISIGTNSDSSILQQPGVATGHGRPGLPAMAAGKSKHSAQHSELTPRPRLLACLPLARAFCNKYDLFVVFGIGLFTQAQYYTLITYLLMGCGGIAMPEAALLIGMQAAIGFIASPLWLALSRYRGIRVTIVALWSLYAIGALLSLALSTERRWVAYLMLAVIGTCLMPALNFAYPMATAHVFNLRRAELVVAPAAQSTQPALATLISMRNIFGAITSSLHSLAVMAIMDSSGFTIAAVVDAPLPDEGQFLWRALFAGSVSGPLFLMAVAYVLCFSHHSSVVSETLTGPRHRHREAAVRNHLYSDASTAATTAEQDRRDGHDPEQAGEEDVDCAAAFNAVDRDGNGLISFADLRSFMRSMGESPADEEVHDMIIEADLDGDGNINLEEFRHAISKPGQFMRHEKHKTSCSA